MKHKYKLGNYVEYYAAQCGRGNKVEYADQRKGFVNAIEDALDEDGNVVVKYRIGPYIGSYEGHMVSEGAIIGELKAPKNTNRIEYLKSKISLNEWQIEYYKSENKSLRKEIAKLEKGQTK